MSERTCTCVCESYKTLRAQYLTVTVCVCYIKHYERGTWLVELMNNREADSLIPQQARGVTALPGPTHKCLMAKLGDCY